MERYEMSHRRKGRESHVCIQIEMQGIMFHLWISPLEGNFPPHFPASPMPRANLRGV